MTKGAKEIRWKYLNASERLAHQRDAIIDLWLERLRHEAPSARNVSKPILQDSLPQWLTRLEQALASPDLLKKIDLVENKAKNHGRERSQHHWVSWILFFCSASLITWITTAFRNSRKITEEAYREQQELKHKAERLYQASVRSEQEFRAIFMLAAAGKAILDSNSERFIKVNPTFCKMLGYTEDELLKKTLSEITHPDDRKEKIQHYQHSAENRSEASTMTKRFLKKNGEVVWVVVSSAPLPNIGDEPPRRVATIHNITDLKRTEHELHTNVTRLQEERALREQFVAMLSHDLRSPLTSAKMSIELMMSYPEKADSIVRLGERANRSLNAADKMIQDLLDANRIQAGQPIPLEIKVTDIAHILIELVEEMTILHGNRFKFIGPNRLEGCWNPLALKRIAENLVSNAVKYGDSIKPITLTLSATSERVEFSVHNFGKPISRNDCDGLFKIFHRSSSATQSGKMGWGIGLALVKGLSEALGGHIWVESSAEAGTTFTVTLPFNTS